MTERGVVERARLVRCARGCGRPPAVNRGRGLCNSCYCKLYGTDELLDYERATRSRDEVLDDWQILRGEGFTVPQAAERMGMTTAALVKALQRARRDGDPRARFTYAGVKSIRRARAAA